MRTSSVNQNSVTTAISRISKQSGNPMVNQTPVAAAISGISKSSAPTAAQATSGILPSQFNPANAEAFAKNYKNYLDKASQVKPEGTLTKEAARTWGQFAKAVAWPKSTAGKVAAVVFYAAAALTATDWATSGGVRKLLGLKKSPAHAKV